MAANLFGRYVWLVDIIRQHKRLTYEEINQLWKTSGLSYGPNDDLPLRTFHNHRKAILDIFNLSIECDKNGYKYYLDNPEQLENDTLRSWLIDSYATLNQIQADSRLAQRIIFENIPSGRTWLTTITSAMRNNQVLNITYQKFQRKAPDIIEVEPYYLRVVKQRWYLIARNLRYAKQGKAAGLPETNAYRTYALDRIKDISPAGKTFEFDKDFDIGQLFEGCCGIISSNAPTETVVIRANAGYANYLRTLPLHASQTEIAQDGNSTIFAYRLKPTLDFYQTLLAQSDQLEILEPETMRDEMRNLIRQIMERYENAPE